MTDKNDLEGRRLRERERREIDRLIQDRERERGDTLIYSIHESTSIQQCDLMRQISRAEVSSTHG